MEFSTQQFVEKVKEFIVSSTEWGTGYDINHDQIYLHTVVDGEVIVYVSPVLYYLSQSEYNSFRSELERLLPEPQREKGRYW